MSMEETFNKIIELSERFPGAVKVNKQEHERKRIYKYIGKFMCPVDEDLLSFLLRFNRVSLLDYFFFGIGEIKGSQDVYRFTLENWQSNNALTAYYLGFASTSSGDILGSMTNYKGSKTFPVGYLEEIDADEFMFVGSGFGVFLNNIVTAVERDLLEVDSLRLSDDDDYIFADNSYWIQNDPELKENLEKDVYKTSTDANWKLEFRLT
jgi:hypothetical protein